MFYLFCTNGGIQSIDYAPKWRFVRTYKCVQSVQSLDWTWNGTSDHSRSRSFIWGPSAHKAECVPFQRLCEDDGRVHIPFCGRNVYPWNPISPTGRILPRPIREPFQHIIVMFYFLYEFWIPCEWGIWKPCWLSIVFVRPNGTFLRILLGIPYVIAYKCTCGFTFNPLIGRICTYERMQFWGIIYRLNPPFVQKIKHYKTTNSSRDSESHGTSQCLSSFQNKRVFVNVSWFG